MTELYQIFAGVGDGGGACIGDQGAGFAGQDPLNDFFSLKSLIVLIVADKAFADTQMIQ